MTQVLARKDAEAFSAYQIEIEKIGDTVDLIPTGKPLSFSEIMALRKPRSPEEFLGGGKAIPANLDVSAVLTISYQTKDYLVLVCQARKDFNDLVAKLISGFISAKDIAVPLKAIQTEIAEEFLPFSGGLLIPGELNNLPLDRPYAKTLSYASSINFRLIPGSRLALRGDHVPLTIQGGKINYSPLFYIHTGTNSAQLVYSFHVNIDEVENLSLSIYHAEDEFDSSGNMLVVRLRKDQLFLAEIDKEELTGNLFRLENGELISQPTDRLLLSEIFAETNGIIVKQNHIPFTHFVKG